MNIMIRRVPFTRAVGARPDPTPAKQPPRDPIGEWMKDGQQLARSECVAKGTKINAVFGETSRRRQKIEGFAPQAIPFVLQPRQLSA